MLRRAGSLVVRLPLLVKQLSMLNMFVAQQLLFIEQHLFDSPQVMARGRSILEVLHSVELICFVGAQRVVYFFPRRLVFVVVLQEVFKVIIDRLERLWRLHAVPDDLLVAMFQSC
jgi:hypothetical protein